MIALDDSLTLLRLVTLVAGLAAVLLLWEIAREPPATGVEFRLVEDAELAPVAEEDDPRQLDVEPGSGTELARERRPPVPEREPPN